MVEIASSDGSRERGVTVAWFLAPFKNAIQMRIELSDRD